MGVSMADDADKAQELENRARDAAVGVRHSQSSRQSAQQNDPSQGFSQL